MKKKIYFYSNVVGKDFLQSVLSGFELIKLEEEGVDSIKIKNQNILLIVKDYFKNIFSKSFILANNTIIFSSKNQKDIIEEKYSQVVFIYAPLNLSFFLNTVQSQFFSKTIFFKDIKIIGETLTNIHEGLSSQITVLEKKFLTELVDYKEIKKEYFLEKILDLKKNIETKTIESHLTRIRKKLLAINSKIQISSKGDIFFIED